MFIKKSLAGVLVLFISALFAFASQTAPIGGDDFPIGSKLDGFTMPDPMGENHDYSDLKGEKGTLIVFLSAQCPVVKMYNDRMESLAKKYKEKGINFVGVYSNHTESQDWVKKHSGEFYTFPVVIDKNNVFADQLGASFTPEVYYFDADDKLQYHGAIDNDRSGRNITKNFLTDAFGEALAGKTISEPKTRAFGCTIKRVKAED